MVVSGELKEQGPQLISSGLDKFVRETPGGKDVLRRISIYAMLPYVIAGVILGLVAAKTLGGKK
jgi:hypothetical protein